MKWKYLNLSLSFLSGLLISFLISSSHAQTIEQPIIAEGDRSLINPPVNIATFRSLNVGDYDAIMYKLDLIYRKCGN